MKEKSQEIRAILHDISNDLHGVYLILEVIDECLQSGDVESCKELLNVALSRKNKGQNSIKDLRNLLKEL